MVPLLSYFNDTSETEGTINLILLSLSHVNVALSSSISKIEI